MRIHQDSERCERVFSMHTSTPSHTLSLSLSLFSVVIQTDHKESLNERGVKRTSISNRELSGSACGLPYLPSLLYGQGHCVWEYHLGQSLSARHQMNHHSRTQGSEHWESPFISWGLALPLWRSIHVCMGVLQHFGRNTPFRDKTHSSCFCCILIINPKAATIQGTIGERNRRCPLYEVFLKYT